MPRGDKTGPEGMGPITGRGMGFCAGYNTAGFANAGFGGNRIGHGFGFGGGRGGWSHRRWQGDAYGWQRTPAGGFHQGPAMPQAVAPVMTREQQLQQLNAQVTHYEQALNALRAHIKEIEATE